jgi:hypothetical protein
MTMVREFMRLYGPTAFGVVSLLLIWKIIVGPELHAQRSVAASQTAAITAAVEEIRGATNSLAAVTATSHQISIALNDTAKILERTVQDMRVMQGGR